MTRGRTIEHAARADEAPETLYSNLLPLHEYPRTVYVARASYDSYRDAWARLRAATDRVVTPAWILHENELMSFVDPSTGPLSNIVERGSIDLVDARDLANAIKPVKQRQFAQLLAGALRDDLGAQGVRYFEKDEVYAFKGKPQEKPRTYTYDSLDEPSTVTVVAHYVTHDKDGSELVVLRHHAFDGTFRRHGQSWLLEVRPTYRFTTDGSHRYKLHGARLMAAKRQEGNRAVLAQMLLWNDILTSRSSRRAARRAMLTFGKLLTFRMDRSVPDHAWMPLVDPRSAPEPGDPVFRAKDPGA